MKKINFLVLLLSASVFAQLNVNVTTITDAFKGSGGLSLDTQGNLYIGDFGDMLGGADPDGIPNHVMKLDTDLILTEYSTGFIGASGNSFDNNGVLYQSDIRDNAIFKIVDGVRTFVTSDGIFSPVGIVFDSQDNFYVCNCGSGTIQKVTPDLTSTIFSSSNLLSCPNGITIDEDDNLYVSNFSNPNIVKITPDGTSTLFGITDLGNGHIDYDPNFRNLYIASYWGQQIFYINLDNPVMDVVAGTGVRGNNDGDEDSSTFSTPNGVAVTDDGLTLYVNCAVPLSGGIINPQIIRRIDILNLSISESQQKRYQVKAYPVPSHETLTVEAILLDDVSNIEISTYNIQGKLLGSTEHILTTKELKETIDISHLPIGNYIYKVTQGKKDLFSGKFVKN